MITPATPNKTTKIPSEVTDTFARLFLPKIQEFYSDPENMKAFEEWQKNQVKSGKKTA